MPKQKQYILVINSSPETLKFKIFHQQDFKLMVTGIVGRIGLDRSVLTLMENFSHRMMMKNYPAGLADHQQALRVVLFYLKPWLKKINLVAHRIVHGGQDFVQTTRVSQKVLEQLKKYNKIEPFDNPINLNCIAVALELLPRADHLAVFDTAFYKTLPADSYLYPISLDYYKNYQIRRYGLSGIAHQLIKDQVAKKIKKSLGKVRLISCFIDATTSVTSIKFGKVFQTSAGLSANGSLMGRTTSGQLDPSIIFYLIRRLGLSISEVEELLFKKSGFFGLTGRKNFKLVLASAGYPVKDLNNPKKFSQAEKQVAGLAIKILTSSLVKEIGAQGTMMGGIDYLAFGGEIAEQNPILRNLIIKDIRKVFKKIKTLTVEVDEELLIAQQARQKAKI